jgi:hypothetical protein
VSLHSFNFFLLGPIKFNKKKVGLVRGKVQAKMVINFFGRRNFMQPMGRPKHTLNVWGAGDLEEDIFQFSPVPTMLTIPQSAQFGWGPQGKGRGGGAPANPELLHQARGHHFFI